MYEVHSSTVVCRDGEILPPPGGKVDSEALAEAQAEKERMLAKSIKEVQEQARRGDCCKRNQLLYRVAVLLGEANQLGGASKITGGVTWGGRIIRGADYNPGENSARKRREAEKTLVLACAACPLRDIVCFSPNKTLEELSGKGKEGAGTRRRFTGRIKSPGNTNTCAKNMAPGRQSRKK